MSADDILLDTEDRMEKAIQHLKQQLSGIRTGRANPGRISFGAGKVTPTTARDPARATTLRNYD